MSLTTSALAVRNARASSSGPEVGLRGGPTCGLRRNDGVPAPTLAVQRGFQHAAAQPRAHCEVSSCETAVRWRVPGKNTMCSMDTQCDLNGARPYIWLALGATFVGNAEDDSKSVTGTRLA